MSLAVVLPWHHSIHADKEDLALEDSCRHYLPLAWRLSVGDGPLKVIAAPASRRLALSPQIDEAVERWEVLSHGVYKPITTFPDLQAWIE